MAATAAAATIRRAKERKGGRKLRLGMADGGSAGNVPTAPAQHHSPVGARGRTPVPRPALHASVDMADRIHYRVARTGNSSAGRTGPPGASGTWHPVGVVRGRKAAEGEHATMLLTTAVFAPLAGALVAGLFGKAIGD